MARRLVGYARLEQHALPTLNATYTLVEDYVNLLQPVLKLVEKPETVRECTGGTIGYRRLTAGRFGQYIHILSRMPPPSTTSCLSALTDADDRPMTADAGDHYVASSRAHPITLDSKMQKSLRYASAGILPINVRGAAPFRN